MTDEDIRLAFGETIVRRYSCTAVDRVAMFAGTVIPVPGRTESEGVMTLTNKRLVFELKAEGSKGSGTMRQEARISQVSSVSSMMSKFGRDLRVPILFMIVGFLLMFVPYVVLSETGAFDLDGEYEQGYNDGVEYAYYESYLRAVQSGSVSHSIPSDYYFYPMEPPVSSDYARGYSVGSTVGRERAAEDISSDSEFSVPEDLRIHSDPAAISLGFAVVGAIVFVIGSLMYLVSNRTKDWIMVNIGSGGKGVYITSVTGEWRETGYRALVAENQYWDMTREIGAAILDMKNYKERRLRVVEEAPVIENSDTGKVIDEDRGMLEAAPDYDDYSEELIIGDDNPRVVGPWGDGD